MERPDNADKMLRTIADRRQYPGVNGMRGREFIQLPSREAFQRKHAAVKRAPEYERPCCTVPDAAKKHRQEKIAVGSGFPVTIAAERHIEIVAKPCRKRDVPA